MCVIIQLPKKKIITFEHLKNAVLNNPHGYGLVCVDRGEITVTKRCDEEKGNDPDEIYKLLQETFDVDRYLHVRYNTVGKTILDNTHPFTVYQSDDRRVEFMHNGTLQDFKFTSTDKSDTFNYANLYLAPLLKRFIGDNGIADYTDPFFQQLVKSHFNYSNRGLLISTDLEPKEFGPWKELKEDEIVLRVSNDDYFTRPQTTRMMTSRLPTMVHGHGHGYRTPDTGQRSGVTEDMFRGVEQKAKTEASEAIGSKGSHPPITSLKDINLAKRTSTVIDPSELNDLMDLSITEWDDITNEYISYYQYLSAGEVENWVKKHPAMASIFVRLLIDRVVETQEDFESADEAQVKANEKHERATKRIEELVLKVNELEGKTKANRPVRRSTKKAA